MLIAHIPASYLIGTTLRRSESTSLPIWAACIAGILPDLDLLWFWLVDSSRHHHTLPSHWPLAWLTVGLILAIVWKPWRATILSALLIVEMHFVLDSIVGAIRWMAPFDMTPLTLVVVPAVYDWWLLNFIFHWTFTAELLIVFLAGMHFTYRLRKKRAFHWKALLPAVVKRNRRN